MTGSSAEQDVPARVSTQDFDEAHETITSIYIPHDLRSRDGRRLDFKLRHLTSARLTVGHLRYGADAELLVPPMLDCYHVNLTLDGMTQVSQRGAHASTEAHRSGVVFGPNDPFTVRWSPEAIQYAIKIPRHSLESQLAAIIGKPVEAPIDFSLGFDLTAPRGRGLLSAVHHLREQLSREGGVADVPMVRAQLESYVLSQVLIAVPNSYDDLLNRPTAGISRRHVARAIDFIEEHAHEPITGPDIAAASFVSLRALQSGFHNELGVSPMTYLRNVRLERVRAELLTRGHDSSVSGVASQWGFTHLSRFSEHYRRRFGELPSETLRRR